MSDDPAVRPPHRIAARRLMRGTGKAALATALARDDAPGWPYASLVTVATAHDGSPILLLSGLSDHCRNLAADTRASLLFDGTAGFANPQQGPRVTILGRIERSDDPGDRARFLARHPAAALYADFGDFAFWRLRMARAHYVGGFATAVWVEAPIEADPPAARRLAAAEADILGHMNEDHPHMIALLAERMLDEAGDGWRMVGVDCDGCDLARGERLARLHFDAPVDGPEAVRKALITLAARTRR